MHVLHGGIAFISDKEQFSTRVVDFDYFFMIFSIFYENVYRGSICTFYMLE